MTSRPRRGYWWLPSSPEDRVPGELVIADDGKCELKLIGGLDLGDPTGVRLGDRVPVIWGEAGGKPISLTNCFTVRRDGFARRDSTYHDIHVHEALVGAHVDNGEEAFQCAIVTIENLASWLTLHTSLKINADDEGQSAINREAPDATCSVDGWTFTARALVQPFQVTAERFDWSSRGRPPHPS